MFSPLLRFEKEDELVWVAGVDDDYYLTEAVDLVVKNFVIKFTNIFGAADASIKVEIGEVPLKRNYSIKDYTVRISFYSPASEAEFIMLKSNGAL